MRRTDDDGPDHITNEQYQEERQRDLDAQAEFEHDAARDCDQLANELTRCLDLYGMTRVAPAIDRMGYKLASK